MQVPCRTGAALLLLLLLKWVCFRAHQQLLSAQVLLDFTSSRIQEVWSRALGRIEMLSHFLYNYSTQKVRPWHPLDRLCCSALLGLLPN